MRKKIKNHVSAVAERVCLKSIQDNCAVFFLLSITFQRNSSIAINLVPLERYSKAQYSALVFVFKK